MMCLCNTSNSVEEVVWSDSFSTSQQSNRTRWLLILAYYLLTLLCQCQWHLRWTEPDQWRTRAANFSPTGLGSVLSLFFTDPVNCYDCITSVVVWSIDGVTLTQALAGETCASAAFFDTKLTRSAVGLNPDLEVEKLETNCLIHSTAHQDAN
jgi:hypothetical protein